MSMIKLAFDKSSRRIDADGRLHIDRSHISKANVSPYYGSEIPGFKELGLVADKVYRLLRDPVELERAAHTFARLPILSEHIPVDVENPRQELVVGAIGSDVQFKAPYLDSDLCIWESKAIAGIETDQVRELSCAYRYVPVMEPGEYEGEHFDGRMTEIQGNHLALVSVGRAGSDVVVADHNPFQKVAEMKMSKLGKALFVALSAASPKLAQDSAIPALFAEANRKTFNKSEIIAKLMACDASLDSNKLDAILDAILEVEQDNPNPVEPAKPIAAAGDESPADKIRALLQGKVEDSILEQVIAACAAPAEDAEPGMKEEEVKTAMDEMGKKIRSEMREAAEAARDVRAVVGDVTMDSAAEIYGFALDQMKIDRKDVAGVAALRALFKVAASNKQEPGAIAQDSAGASQKFPGLDRFSKA